MVAAATRAGGIMTWWDLATWDWPTIGKSAVGAGAGTALVQGLLTVMRDRTKKKAHADFHALRVAVALEDYARAASDIISESEMHSDSGGHAGRPAKSMPDVPAFADDPDGWRAMPRHLMERAFTFPQRASDSSRNLSYLWDFGGDPDDYEGAIVRECAERGRDACLVAAALRKGRFDELRGDFVDHLNKKIAEMEKADRERRERPPSFPFMVSPPAPPPPPHEAT